MRALPIEGAANEIGEISGEQLSEKPNCMPRQGALYESRDRP